MSGAIFLEGNRVDNLFVGDGGGSEDMHNYSTTEHVVGTWIDGSNVYERTFNIGLTNIPVDFTYFSISLTADLVVSVDIILDDSYQTYIYSNLPVVYRRSDGAIGVFNNFSGSLGDCNCYIVVRYTK